MNWAKKYIKTILLASLICFLLPGFVYSATNEPVKKEQLPFKLLGTVLESNPNESLAVIRHLGSTTQGSYKVLDKILGYQIIKIMRTRVMLLKDGKLSFLEFPLGSEFEPIVAISSNERIVNRNALAKKFPDLNVALFQALPIPHIESGKIIGLKIAKLKDKALADMAGIKEGDIATRVNGERLDSIQKALALYQNLKNQEKFDLEIKRGNTIKNLTYYVY